MTDPLWALSFWRPWPSLILRTDAKRKECENRSRPPPKGTLGRRIALHAGQTYGMGSWPFGDEAPPADEDCPTGIVGTALLLGYLDRREGRRVAESSYGTLFSAHDEHFGHIQRQLDALDTSPWWVGPVGLLLVQPRTLRQPVPLNGQQGWWKLADHTAARVRELGG